jgi:translation initiation factor IF-1
LPAIAGKAGGQTTKGQRAVEVNRPYLKQGMVNSEKAIQLEGTIMMVLPGTMFRVALANDRLVLAHISGKMRKRFIRLTIGDRVKMEMSPYDTAKARIVYRL